MEAKTPGDKDVNYNLWVWTCVILIAIIILITVIVLIILNVSDASSSALTLGPGDNSPCVNYSVLSEYWRMIGRRPLAPGVGYNCDIFLEVRSTMSRKRVLKGGGNLFKQSKL